GSCASRRPRFLRSNLVGSGSNDALELFTKLLLPGQGQMRAFRQVWFPREILGELQGQTLKVGVRRQQWHVELFGRFHFLLSGNLGCAKGTIAEEEMRSQESVERLPIVFLIVMGARIVVDMRLQAIKGVIHAKDRRR